MSELRFIPSGGGEIVGDSPERRVEILSDDETLNATWSRFGPHRVGADLHVHRRHTDLFYVLEGELTVGLGVEGAGTTVPAGWLARVPPLVVHGFRNESDSDVRYLNLHAPGRRFADYMRALRDQRRFAYDQHPPPADGGRPTTDAVVGAGEALVDRADLRLTLHADVGELGLAETWSQPDGLPAASHVHRRHVESLYVLEGELAIVAGGRELRAVAGSWVQVPAGLAHSLACAPGSAARFLELHTPSLGYGAYLRGLAAGLDDRLAAERAAFDRMPA
jgi:quercetin dioxygenase-like cupin family protein